MSEYSEVKASAARLMALLIDADTHLVRFPSLIALHASLNRHGFHLIQKQAYGPAGGYQLFYARGRLLVRLKTRGDENGPRANQPHLSVSLYDGKALDWQNDQAKFNARGGVEPKAMTTPDRFNEIDFQGNPQRFMLILGGKYDGPGADAWANRTHFQFPTSCNFGGVEDLQVQS
jgi:hypothetical protein